MGGTRGFIPYAAVASLEATAMGGPPDMQVGSMRLCCNPHVSHPQQAKVRAEEAVAVRVVALEVGVLWLWISSRR